jgi:hypothetical protein
MMREETSLVPYRGAALERVVPGRLVVVRGWRFLAAVRWIGRLLGITAWRVVEAAPCPRVRRIWRRGRSLALAAPPPQPSPAAMPAREDRRPPSEAARLAEGMGLSSLALALADDRPDVRCRAIETIGDLSADAASLLLMEPLHDPASAEVRRAAARAAASARAEATVFALFLLLDDFDLEVRREAVQAIEAITGQRLGLEPDATPEVRRARIERLKQWWQEERLARLMSAELLTRHAS